MFSQHLMSDTEKTFYTGQLAQMSDADFTDEVASVVTSASYDATHSRYDQKAQLCFAEANRRDGQHLYQRGYNRYLASTGQDLDPPEILSASPRKAA